MANSDDILNELTKDRKPKPKGGIAGMQQAKDSGFLPYLAGIGGAAGVGAFVYNEFDNARNVVLAEIAKERKEASNINRAFRVGNEKGPLAYPIGNAIRSPSGIPADVYDYEQRVKGIKTERQAAVQRAEGEKGRAKQQTQQAQDYGKKVPTKKPKAEKIPLGNSTGFELKRKIALNALAEIESMPATTKADMLAREQAVLKMMNTPGFLGLEGAEFQQMQDFLEIQVKKRGLLPQPAQPRLNPNTYVIPPSAPKLTAEQEALNEIRKLRSVLGDPIGRTVDVNSEAWHRAFPRLVPAPEGSTRPTSTRMVEMIVPSTGERFTTEVGPNTKVVGPQSVPLRTPPPKLPTNLLNAVGNFAGKAAQKLTSKWVTVPLGVYNAAKVGLDVYNAEKDNALNQYLQSGTTLRSLARPMTDYPASFMAGVAGSRYNLTPEQQFQMETRFKDYGQLLSLMTGANSLPFILSQEIDANLAGER